MMIKSVVFIVGRADELFSEHRPFMTRKGVVNTTPFCVSEFITEWFGKPLLITLLRKADFVCRPFLDGEWFPE